MVFNQVFNEFEFYAYIFFFIDTVNAILSIPVELEKEILTYWYFHVLLNFCLLQKCCSLSDGFTVMLKPINSHEEHLPNHFTAHHPINM